MRGCKHCAPEAQFETGAVNISVSLNEFFAPHVEYSSSWKRYTEYTLQLAVKRFEIKCLILRVLPLRYILRDQTLDDLSRSMQSHNRKYCTLSQGRTEIHIPWVRSFDPLIIQNKARPTPNNYRDKRHLSVHAMLRKINNPPQSWKIKLWRSYVYLARHLSLTTHIQSKNGPYGILSLVSNYCSNIAEVLRTRTRYWIYTCALCTFTNEWSWLYLGCALS